MIWDIGGILAGVAAVLAALWSRQAKRSAGRAADQTNGALSGPLALILDGQRSLGHQIGEVRKDLGRLDERVSGEVCELRRRLDSTP